MHDPDGFRAEGQHLEPRRGAGAPLDDPHPHLEHLDGSERDPSRGFQIDLTTFSVLGKNWMLG